MPVEMKTRLVALLLLFLVLLAPLSGRAAFGERIVIAGTEFKAGADRITGGSFGARGTASSRRPASCGRRSALRWFTSFADHTRFSHESAPPRERGTTWSGLPSSGRRASGASWERARSSPHDHRRHTDDAVRGADKVVTMRTGSLNHSSHVTGRRACASVVSPSLMSSAVAAFVAVWQNASAGVQDVDRLPVP